MANSIKTFWKNIGNKFDQLWEKAPPGLQKMRPYLRKAMWIGLILFFIGVIAVWGFYLSVRYGAFGKLPTKTELKDIQNPIASEVYSEDGVLLGKYYTENRTNISHKRISNHLKNALVATEDARFYDHGGVDVKSLLRVLFKTILMRDQSAGGGSTISQQLAKNLYGRERYGKLTVPVNKTREMIIAGRLERIYSKREIMTMYLNTVSFGEDVFGIQTAAKRYFNTIPDSLTVDQAAVLIGMLKAPSYYNPRVNPERAKGRRNQVLIQMNKYDYLPNDNLDSLKKKPLDLQYNFVSFSDGAAPYFRDYLKKELKIWCKNNKKKDGSSYNLYTDGLKIHTTINSKMQTYAEESVKEHMTNLQKDFDKHWKGRKPWGNNLKFIEKEVAKSERYRKGKEAGKTQAQLNAEFRKPIKMRVFTHEGEKEVTMSPIDSIAHYLYFLNTGFMAINPYNGQIKAWVGGINHKRFKFDHIHAKRQVGSTFKPIVYATALDEGEHPCNYFPNRRIMYPEYQNWAPENSDSKYGGYYSMKGALANSVNTVAVQLLMEVGVDKVINMAKNMGIRDSEIPKVPSIALGTAELTLYEMMNVYTTIANRGYRVNPVYISEIQDRKGRTIEKFDIRYPKKNQVMHPEDAKLMVEMMRSVVDSGTARRLRWKYKLDTDIAGKTGTTQSHADGWFMGITPKLVGGVWVGGSNNFIRFRSISLGQGANMALPIWGLFFDKVFKDKDFRDIKNARFPARDSIITDLMDCYQFRNYLPIAQTVSDPDPVESPGNTTVIVRDDKPDIVISNPGKKPPVTRPNNKTSTEPEKLKDQIRGLFKKKKRKKKNKN